MSFLHLRRCCGLLSRNQILWQKSRGNQLLESGGSRLDPLVYFWRKPCKKRILPGGGGGACGCCNGGSWWFVVLESKREYRRLFHLVEGGYRGACASRCGHAEQANQNQAHMGRSDHGALIDAFWPAV